MKILHKILSHLTGYLLTITKRGVRKKIMNFHMHAVILTRNRYKFNHHLRLMPHDSFFILTSSMTSFIDIFKLPKVQTIHILDAKSVM